MKNMTKNMMMCDDAIKIFKYACDMAKMHTWKREVVSLMAVIGAGMATAVVIVLYLLYVYGPTGQYRAENILIEPSLLDRLTYQDGGGQKGKKAIYELDAIVFFYHDKQKGKEEMYTLSKEQYDAIYKLVKRDLSVVFVSKEIEQLFASRDVSTLEVRVKPQFNPRYPSSEKEITTIVFHPDSPYYRVKLRASSGWEQYAYFYHDGVFSAVTSIIR